MKVHSRPRQLATGLCLLVACGGVAPTTPIQVPAPTAALGSKADPATKTPASNALGSSQPQSPVTLAHVARSLPAEPQIDLNLGASAGKYRGLLARLRFVVDARTGAVDAAKMPFSVVPTAHLSVSTQLGGGFLFLLGRVVYRAESWVAELRPLFQVAGTPLALSAGLDRVYVAFKSGVLAFDPVTGAEMDRGPLAPAPQLQLQVTRDAFHAAALGDFVGLLVTRDGGHDWTRVALPFHPMKLLATAEGYHVSSPAREADAERAALISPRGDVTLLASASASPAALATGALRPAYLESSSELANRRMLEDWPLTAAVRSGAPVGAHEALVLRGGSLFRINLDLGTVLSRVDNYYARASATCTPLPDAAPAAELAEPQSGTFACTEPGGATELVVAGARTPRVLASFDHIRLVSSAWNGRFVVDGPCSARVLPTAESAWTFKLGVVDRSALPAASSRVAAVASVAPAPRATAAPVEPTKVPSSIARACVVDGERPARELALRGDVADVRIVPLRDGSIVAVTPPRGDWSRASVAVLRGDTPTSVALSAAQLPKEQANLLVAGRWLSGFYEKRPGVVGGWVELAGKYLGVEITQSGAIVVGTPRSAEGLALAGPYALRTMGTRIGEQSHDGGIHWDGAELPVVAAAAGPLRTALVPLGASASSASPRQAFQCGPLGCVLGEWLRVGWGVARSANGGVLTETKEPALAASELIRGASAQPAPLALRCGVVARTSTAASAASVHIAAMPTQRSPGWCVGFGCSSSIPERIKSPEFTPFLDAPPPVGGPVRVSSNIVDSLEMAVRGGRTGQLYAWGASEETWDTTARWLLRWQPPYSGEIVSTRASRMPQPAALLLTTPMRGYGAQYFAMHSAVGAAFALLASRDNRNGRNATRLYLAEPGASLSEIVRADAEPFGEFAGAAMLEGRMVIAAHGLQDESPRLQLFAVEGGTARAIAVLARSPGSAARVLGLATADNGRRAAIVIDEAGSGSGFEADRWLLPFGANGEIDLPIRVSAATTGAAPGLSVCRSQGGGYVYDASMAGSQFDVRAADSLTPAALSRLRVRVRTTAEGTCVIALSGGLTEPLPAGFDRAAVSPNGALLRLADESRTHEMRCSEAVGAARTIEW